MWSHQGAKHPDHCAFGKPFKLMILNVCRQNKALKLLIFFWRQRTDRQGMDRSLQFNGERRIDETLAGDP